VGAIELLDRPGLAVPESAIREGLATTQWPGRLQFVSQQPYIVLDGAHNPKASRATAANLRKLLDYDTLILILGVLEDKDITGILNEWIDIAEVFILTKPDSDRAAKPQSLAQFIPSDKQVVLKNSIDQALIYAQHLAQATDLICVTGSLYTVGEALALLQGHQGRRRSNQ
jgi:dihydrofolate synthase/folylpolyglutamate synthase